MLIECCSQERSYLRFFGLLGQVCGWTVHVAVHLFNYLLDAGDGCCYVQYLVKQCDVICFVAYIQRLCQLNQVWVEKFDEAFQQQVMVFPLVSYHGLNSLSPPPSLLPPNSMLLFIGWRQTSSGTWPNSLPSCSMPMLCRGPACPVSTSTRRRQTRPGEDTYFTGHPKACIYNIHTIKLSVYMPLCQTANVHVFVALYCQFCCRCS